MAFKFLEHKELEGRHAFLSASKYQWLRYSKSKLADSYYSSMSAAEGTRLHNLAAELISMNVKLPNSSKTLNRYVNDCIGFGMETEVLLVASRNAFGTADAIKLEEPSRKNKLPILRIFDLKNGVNEAKFDQLVIYAAFFCLEYGFLPAHIDIELRLYQNDEVRTLSTLPSDDSGYPDPDLLQRVTFAMDKMLDFDRIIDSLRKGIVPDDIGSDDDDDEIPEFDNF